MPSPQNLSGHAGRMRHGYELALPMDANIIARQAHSRGLPRAEAAVFAQVAQQKLRSLHRETGRPVSPTQVAVAVKRDAKEEVERSVATQEQIEAKGVTIADAMEMLANGVEDKNASSDHLRGGITIVAEEKDGRCTKRFKFDDDSLDRFFGGEDPYNMGRGMRNISLLHNGSDIITAICQHTELAVQLGKHLHAEDIINLYSANRMFHNAVNEHLLSSIKAWIAHRAPEAGRIFPFKLYRRLLVPDPAGRRLGDFLPATGRPQNELSRWMMRRTRSVPGLRYLQLVLGRDKGCREMVAILARNGHRCPPTMHSTLLRLWLLMDISTTRQRRALLRNKGLWTDVDLYNAQFFFVKLGLHFNDPVYGPGSYDLLILMMGQKGLYPLWQLLMRKQYTSLPEILKLAVRYSWVLTSGHWTSDFFTGDIHGVPFHECGVGHCEGWGLGDQHLMRPDELVPMEAVRRGLDLDNHIRYMMVWGYFDHKTGENLVPTEDEMYISDEERTLAHMDRAHHWRRKHVLKKRFHTLTPAEQRDIVEEDEDECLRAMGWCGEEEDMNDCQSGDDVDTSYSLEDEINRGYIVCPQPKGGGGDDGDDEYAGPVPDVDDEKAWGLFVNEVLIGLPPQLTADEALQAEAWHSYQDGERDYEWDWTRWLDEQRKKDVHNVSGRKGTWGAADANDGDQGGCADRCREENDDDADAGHWEWGMLYSDEDDGDEDDGCAAGDDEMQID